MLWQNHFHCCIYTNWFDKHYLRIVFYYSRLFVLLKLICLQRIYIKMAGRKADKQAGRYPDRHSDIIAFALLLRSVICWYRRVSMPGDRSLFTDVHPLFTYAAYLGRDELFCQWPSYLQPGQNRSVRCNRRDTIFFHFFFYFARCQRQREWNRRRYNAVIHDSNM